VRCARCGNENQDGNRFCGMCGATLLTAPAASATVRSAPQAPASPSVPASSVPLSPAPPSSAPIPARPQAPEPSRAAAPVSDYSPGISGPSFLGLGDPGPRKRASLSVDPHARSSNLDYLLEDDEEPRRGGAGKFVLIVLALALAAGFGYLRWKNQKFGWLGLGTSKPSASAQTPDVTDTTSTTPPAAGSPGATTTTPSIQPATDPSSGAPANSPAANPASNTTASPPTATTPASPPPSTPDAAPSSAPAAAAPTDASPTDASPAATPDNPAPANPKPTKAAEAPPAKPTAASKPARPIDAVSEAQKYLYGKGVPQDCERGMRLLKPAVNQSNPKAMVEMGALYSAGLCTPHDLPTAYRWFALALRKEPDNQAVQSDLQKLWGEMTQPERQLAIKLSH
jgi:hypothetical protein